MKTFKEYLTGESNGYSFREIINELTDVELEKRVQDYMQQQLKNCNLQNVNQQRELLLAFFEFIQPIESKSYWIEQIDEFLSKQ